MADEELVHAKINEAYELLKDPELPERLFYALEGVSGILLAWMQMQGKPGWSSHLKNEDKTPFFSKEQQAIIENAALKADPYLRPLLSKYKVELQEGGANKEEPSASASSKQISMDGIFYGTLDTMDQINNDFHEWQSKLGVVQRISKVKPKQLAVISTPLFITLIYSILDFLRLAVGNPLVDIAPLRVILSLVVATLDLLTGDWKNAILSFSGAISANLTVLGFFLKIVNTMWQMIAPSLREKLIITGYQSSKSLVVGFLLWSFATFLPDEMKPPADKFFEGIAKTADEVNKISEKAQGAAQQQLDTMGLPLKVSFFKIEKDNLPTFDQIQNIQELLGNENIVCLQEFQDNVIKSVGNASLALLLVFQLLNIPTDPQALERVCRQKPRTLDALIGKVAQPKIEAKGGRRFTRKRQRDRSSSTSIPAKR